MPYKKPIPLSWQSWTDEPDKPETELTFRDLTPARQFDPNKMFDLSASWPPRSDKKLKKPATDAEASTSTSTVPVEEAPFAGIGFRRPLMKETMTVLDGDRAQAFRAKPIDPNFVPTPTIGFEHSLTLKSHLEMVEQQKAAKNARANRLAQRRKKRD